MPTIKILTQKGKKIYPVTIGDAVVVGNKTLTKYIDDVGNSLSNTEKVINSLTDKTNEKIDIHTQGNTILGQSKSDKVIVEGTMTVKGPTTFNEKITLPTGGSLGTVLDIPGNLGIGSQTDPVVTGRINTYRVTTGGYKFCSKSAIGYNPKVNKQETKDYGMKYQVQYNIDGVNNIDKADGASFYLSYSGCILGLSGDPAKKVTTFYDVLHEGNSYFKDELDEMINYLQEKIDDQERTIKLLTQALRTLGVDLDEIELPSEPAIAAFGLDYNPITEIQNKERGFTPEGEIIYE